MRPARRHTVLLPILPVLATLACAGPPAATPCSPIDPVLAASGFVAVIEPVAGQRTESPLSVRGCSRTFESNVVWRLRARDGAVLDSGQTSGGGADGAAGFQFGAWFHVEAPQLAHLEVFEPDASDGEGFPPGRSVIPIVLMPSPDAEQEGGADAHSGAAPGS